MKMRLDFFVTTISLLCVCYGQKYDISGYLHLSIFTLALIDVKN